MSLYDYDVEGEEAYFEPIEAKDVYDAQAKIRRILRKQSVWAHGTQPFIGTVRMVEQNDQRPHRFDADCAVASESEV